MTPIGEFEKEQYKILYEILVILQVYINEILVMLQFLSHFINTERTN